MWRRVTGCLLPDVSRHFMDITMLSLETSGTNHLWQGCLICTDGKAEQDGQCTYKRNNGAHSRNHCCRGKATSITNSQCVSAALVIQRAKRTRRIILSSVACLDLLYFSTLSHKRYDFQKNVIEHKCLFLFSLQLFVWNISHYNNAAIYHKCTWVFMQSIRYSCQALIKLEFFSTDFRKML